LVICRYYVRPSSVAVFACGSFCFVESASLWGGGVAADVSPSSGGECCFPRYSEFVEHGSCFVALGFGGDNSGVPFGFRWFDDESH
jgi:hypothetical protein